MNNDIKVKLCQDDFYLMMQNAVLQAGGRDYLDQWKRERLEDIVNQFAQNGIRMVYMPEKHMNALKIIWEAPKANNNNTLPKKKQLLCDSMDKGEDDCEWNKDDMGG